MPDGPVEILFVDDDPADVRLTLESFAEYRLANRVRVVTDGAEALEYIFCTGRYADRRIEDVPKISEVTTCGAGATYSCRERAGT